LNSCLPLAIGAEVEGLGVMPYKSNFLPCGVSRSAIVPLLSL